MNNKNVTYFDSFGVAETETSYLSYKILVIFIICGKCGSKRKSIFKEEESNKKTKNSWFVQKYIISLKVWKTKRKP